MEKYLRPIQAFVRENLSLSFEIHPMPAAVANLV
jgi:hypothetical protein